MASNGKIHKTNSTSWSPQYVDREEDVTCRNDMLGDDQPKPKKDPTAQNQTYTPECTLGYSLETIIEGKSETNIGQFRKQSNSHELACTNKKCAPTIAGQGVRVFILLLFLATLVFDPHSYFDCVVAALYYYCYHFIDYIS